MAASAHAIRVVREFQGGPVRGFVMAVRIVTGGAGHLAFQETLRSLERFDDEGSLTEATVLVKTFSRELAEGDTLVVNN